MAYTGLTRAVGGLKKALPPKGAGGVRVISLCPFYMIFTNTGHYGPVACLDNGNSLYSPVFLSSYGGFYRSRT